MNMIEENDRNKLLYVLECMGLDPSIIYNILVVFKDKEIVLAKRIEDLFINDLVDLGINVVDCRYVNYLVDIARDNVQGKRKSLML